MDGQKITAALARGRRLCCGGGEEAYMSKRQMRSLEPEKTADGQHIHYELVVHARNLFGYCSRLRFKTIFITVCIYM
jgi:hypothetical protein